MWGPVVLRDNLRYKMAAGWRRSMTIVVGPTTSNRVYSSSPPPSFHFNHWTLTAFCCFGKTAVSVLHDVQLLLNKQQQIWGGVYIHLSTDIFRVITQFKCARPNFILRRFAEQITYRYRYFNKNVYFAKHNNC